MRTTGAGFPARRVSFGVVRAARLRSGQTQQTVNLSAKRLRRFESSPRHQPSLAVAGHARAGAERASAGEPDRCGGFVGEAAAERIRRAGNIGFAGSRVGSQAGLPAEVERRVGRSKRDEGGSNSVVESQPSKLLVAGSIPVSRSTHLCTPPMQACLGAMARRAAGGAATFAAAVHDEEVARPASGPHAARWPM